MGLCHNMNDKQCDNNNGNNNDNSDIMEKNGKERAWEQRHH